MRHSACHRWRVLAASLCIVHVLGSFEVGGGEQVALNLARGQVAHGHRVHVISLASGAQGPHAAHFRAAGVTTHVLPKRGPSLDPTLPLRMARLLWRLGASVVHTHNPLPLIYAGPAARLSRTPLVHTKHGFDLAPARRAVLRRWAARCARRLVAVSQQTAEDARRQRECRSDNLSVVENGIDLTAYAPSPELKCQVREELGIPVDAFVIGTVGRLSEVKNQPLLVRAAAPLLSERVRLVIVGEGPHRPAVERARMQTDHPERVLLLGQRLDVPRLLPGFDVFALSSLSEGLPMVLVEAMATGLPIVTTRVGGVAGVVRQEQTGLLTPSDDEPALRAALQRFLDDPSLAARYGHSARCLALEHYSERRMVDAYLAVYQQAIAG